MGKNEVGLSTYKLFVYTFQIEFVECILLKLPRINFAVICPKGAKLLLLDCDKINII
jgi:hypothetical protein